MPNVENEGSETEELYQNPMERYAITEDKIKEYLKDKRWIKFNKKNPDPVCRVYKTIYFGHKDSGKTHCLNSIVDFHLGNPEMEKRKNSHVKFLLENGYLLPGMPLIAQDAEGKFTLMRRKGKFKGKPIMVIDNNHPNGPLPVMGNPIEFMEEFILFLHTASWGHENPEEFHELTKEDECEGLKGVNAVVFENYTILTNEIMNNTKILSHDDNIEKIKKQAKDLVVPIVKNYDVWDIRNRNWDYIGGYTQRLLIHYGVSARVRTVWKHGKPTDEEKPAEYSDAKNAFNIVVAIWREEDENGKIVFWGRIIDSDFLEEGTETEDIKNPTYLNIVSEICKYSHAEILELNGVWKVSRKNGKKYWFSNKELEKGDKK